MKFGGAPFKLTPQDMGNVDIGSAFGRGLDNYIKLRQAQYTQPLLQEQLAQAQIGTDYMPREKDADLAYKGASTGLIGKQVDWFDRKAQSDLDSAAAGRDLTRASARGQNAAAYGTEIDNRTRGYGNWMDLGQKAYDLMIGKPASTEAIRAGAEAQRVLTAHQRELSPLQVQQLMQTVEEGRRQAEIQQASQQGRLNRVASDEVRSAQQYQDLLNNPELSSSIPGVQERFIAENLSRNAPNAPGILTRWGNSIRSKFGFNPNNQQEIARQLYGQSIGSPVNYIDASNSERAAARRLGMGIDEYYEYKREIENRSGSRISDRQMEEIITALVKRMRRGG